jgi:hypothetical protein
VPPPGAPPLFGQAGGRLTPPPPSPSGGLSRALALGAVVIGLAVAGLLALALRDGSSGSTGLSPIAEAAERTGELGGVRFSGTGHMTASGMSMDMTFSGAFDTATDRARLEMRAQTPGAPQIADMMNPLVEVTEGPVVFMSSPAFAGQLPDGKTWMKLDLSDVTPDEAGSAAPATSMDARALLTQLEAVGDARMVGKDAVSGVPTTHYTATIDPALEAEQLREDGDELCAQVMEQQTRSSVVDVWIDRKSLVRRLAMSVPFDAVAGPGASMSLRMDFYDFGATPEIGVPSEDDAFDATDLAIQGLEDAIG